jgi:hypothetical protein
MGQRTVAFLVRLWVAMAVLFGLLSVFAIVVSWVRPVLNIALANLALTAAMAVMNSIMLDRLRGK